MAETESGGKMSSKLFSRKIAGVPLVYVLAAVALVVAYFAWRAKPSTSSPAGAAPDATADANIPAPEAYPQVYTSTADSQSPNAYTPATANASITTNDEWLTRGVAFLIARGYNPGAAQAALQAYLNGDDISYEQGRMRDEVVREYGIPPAPTNVGNTGAMPARIQGPIPRTHSVRSTNEDTAAKLAQLYYGDAGLASVIAAANDGRSDYAVGQSVQIPARPVAPSQTVPGPSAPPPTVPAPAPPVPARRTYTVVRGDTLSGIASRFGVAGGWSALYAANRAVIGGNPNLIYPGQTLVIP